MLRQFRWQNEWIVVGCETPRPPFHIVGIVPQPPEPVAPFGVEMNRAPPRLSASAGRNASVQLPSRTKAHSSMTT